MAANVRHPRLSRNVDPWDDWRKAMLEKALLLLEEPWLVAVELNSLILDISTGQMTKTEGLETLEDHVSRLFPTKWMPTPPRRSTYPKLKSNKHCWRSQYAHIQWREAFLRSDKEVDGLEESWISTYVTPGVSSIKASFSCIRYRYWLVQFGSPISQNITCSGAA